MTYKEYIKKLKNEWIGKKVKYEGEIYKVVDVDYNGMLLINKKARFSNTTAVSKCMTERRLPLSF